MEEKEEEGKERRKNPVEGYSFTSSIIIYDSCCDCDREM